MRPLSAIALLGRDFAQTPAQLRRARRTKGDRFFWFDEASVSAVYDRKFKAPMLWNSNFFTTPESMKILRVFTDVPGRCAMTLAKTPWYCETVTNNIALVAEWGEDFSIRHLVMPNHLECCTYPVLEWIAEYVPAAPVNVMAQFHPDNFCDPASDKYPEKYAEIAHRPTHTVPRLRNLKRRSSKRLMRRFNKAGQQGGQAFSWMPSTLLVRQSTARIGLASCHIFHHSPMTFTITRLSRCPSNSA
jgi:hypothetical protein